MVVNGKVEGPINGEDVVLKSHAVVTGDIQAESLSIERGAYFEGRSLRPDVTNLRRLETPHRMDTLKNHVFKKEDEPETKVARA